MRGKTMRTTKAEARHATIERHRQRNEKYRTYTIDTKQLTRELKK